MGKTSFKYNEGIREITMSKKNKVASTVSTVITSVAKAFYNYSKIHPMIAFGVMQLMNNLAHITIAPDTSFPGSFFGKKIATRQDALSECFQITGAKFGDLLSAEAIAGITPLVVGLTGNISDITGLRSIKQSRIKPTKKS